MDEARFYAEADGDGAGVGADVARLMLGRGAGEEDGGGVGGRAGRADRYPALVLLGLVRVLDQFEAGLADMVAKRLVIVADDEGEVG